ncbi:MAG: cytochrome P450 [Nevskiales bacterium]
MPTTTATSQTIRCFADLPGPRGVPVLGNALQIQTDRIHQTIEQWGSEFGTPYGISLGNQKAIVISEPDLIAEALRERPHRFRRFASLERIAEELGVIGLFSSEGETWQRQRRAWMKALSVHHVKPFFEQLGEITARLQKRWEAAADAGEAVDVQADLMRYTVDVTTLFAFGVDTNTLEQEGDLIQEHLAQFFYMLNRRIGSPFPYWRWFKLPVDRRLDQSVAVVREFVNNTIAEARQRIADNPALAEQPTNLLEALIVARDEDGSAFTDTEIFGNTLTALLAGEDTTANTLSWMIHLLSKHPQEQKQLQAGVDQALGNAPMWSQLEDGDQLKCIDAVMSETLRMKPVAPLIFLCAVEDTVLGDIKIEAGTNLIMSMRMAAVDEQQYKEADVFRPQRWLEEKRLFAINPPMPFGGGPRMCPGRSLAQMEIKSVTSMLARNFDIEAIDADNVGEKHSFTLMPSRLKVRFHRRSA